MRCGTKELLLGKFDDKIVDCLYNQKINSVICRNKRYRMDKEKNIAEEIKTKDDIKKFFRRMIEDKQAVADCIRAGRPLSDLKNRGIKIAKLTDVLS